MQGLLYIAFALFLTFVGLLIETYTRARALKLRINPLILPLIPFALFGVNIQFVLSSKYSREARRWVARNYLFSYKKTLTVFLATLITVMSKHKRAEESDRSVEVRARNLFSAGRAYGSVASLV